MRLDESGIDLDRPFGESVPVGIPIPAEDMERLRDSFAAPDYQEKIRSLQWKLARSAHEAMFRMVD